MSEIKITVNEFQYQILVHSLIMYKSQIQEDISRRGPDKPNEFYRRHLNDCEEALQKVKEAKP